ncbi:MAG TPA: HEPN domain-containing protein [Stellaceae bacterium]|nr:HEPN domain-containing protein [Stellaceae bacterium]
MAEFAGKTLEGKWWRPDSPDDAFDGVLQLEEDFAGSLTIKGLASKLFAFRLPSSRTLFGRMRGHYQYDVTLFRTGMMRGPAIGSSSGGDHDSEMQLFTNTILVGGHIDSEDEHVVSAALVRATGLDEWCDGSGFEGQMEMPSASFGTERVNLSYQGSASEFYPTGAGNALRLVSHYRGPMFFHGPKDVIMREEDLIELRFDNDLSINQVLHEIGIWQSFITFALRRPSYMDEIRLTLKESVEAPFGSTLLVPGRKNDISAKNRRRRDILFTRSALGDRIGMFIEAWRQNYTKIEMPVMLLTGTTYQSDAFLHSKLLACLQALEVLHRERHEGSRFSDNEARRTTINALRSAIPGTLDPILFDEISQQLGFVGELTLLDRLKYFFGLYPLTLRPLFPAGDSDMALLKDARNFLTHYGRGKEFNREFLESRKLLILAEKAQLFVEICFLGLLGMNDQEIVGMINRFEPYVNCRTTNHR